MATDYKFQGWLGLDKDAINGNMKWQSFEPKTFEETDIDIKITHCGFGMPQPSLYPLSDQFLAFVHQIFTHFDQDGVQQTILYVSATRSLARL